ncbi:MAG TPA: Zn-dependent hydrolase [Thermomicrobiales bacterium]|nr:Zn-dependent hydrolase [Thermomicrobiales bacterium]
MAEQISIDPAVVEERIMTLARIGACHETGVCRPTYTPEWIAAQALVEQWAQAAGMATRYDAVGDLYGRVEGSEGGKVILTGSHIDSQMPGGRYDGALGVISALTAIETLVRTYGQPRRPLEMISFCEEEGSAFSGARFWGSRAITSDIPDGEWNRIKGIYGDMTGKPIGDVMRQLGYPPERIPDARRDDLDVFIELHVEQGPILEQQGLPVGIVNIINGTRGFQVTVQGVANHAGARPMDMRNDPLVAAAEMVLAVNRNALAMGRPAVSTVGHLVVEPNGSAIIPDKVTFSIDCRHNDPVKLAELRAAHERSVTEIAAKHGVEVSWSQRPPLEPCVCDPDVVATLEAAAREQGIPALTMPSGALHDTQRMSKVARVAMIFVQSRDGRSHTPAEFTSIEHAVAGIQVLAAALHKLAY